MNIALFDFDGTITTEDTYTKFLFYATPKLRIAIGGLLALPVILLYKLGWLQASKTRPVLSKVAFWMRKESDVAQIAERYADEYLNTVIRPEAKEKLDWHRKRDDQIYLVSASLDVYLKVWCKPLGITPVCSELEVRNGRYTGRYVQGDCSKENKVTFLKRAVDLADYDKVYAYGDTYEDLPMLELADEKLYQWKPMK
ncbi:HAD family hydrolase [Vibrio nigripulchritudo]|uniref:HAD family hydrolase n=1 Tax=Vibrio nigripulchritudo TaxID=28173 RepID=UPI0005FA8121|nr:HAD family hydrolase [Vibrio nigripulchritudo]KJY78886.1 phosphoserine phosphatase [Vibrio nigripulchritudo]